MTTVQCLSGTGSLRVGGEFLARHYHQVRAALFSFLFASIMNIMFRVGLRLTNLPWLAADYIHPCTNMGKSYQSLHSCRAECEDIPLL